MASRQLVTHSPKALNHYRKQMSLSVDLLAKNSSSAKDMIKRGAVKVDGEVVDAGFSLTSGQTVVIQAGKKAYAKVTVA